MKKHYIIPEQTIAQLSVQFQLLLLSGLDDNNASGDGNGINDGEGDKESITPGGSGSGDDANYARGWDAFDSW